MSKTKLALELRHKLLKVETADLNCAWLRFCKISSFMVSSLFHFPLYKIKTNYICKRFATKIVHATVSFSFTTNSAAIYQI